jgi:hypothetical protein
MYRTNAQIQATVNLRKLNRQNSRASHKAWHLSLWLLSLFSSFSNVDRAVLILDISEATTCMGVDLEDPTWWQRTRWIAPLMPNSTASRLFFFLNRGGDLFRGNWKMEQLEEKVAIRDLGISLLVYSSSNALFCQMPLPNQVILPFSLLLNN